jgi:light-regulated signal transduction histidine kinase (bacteriophytochrome)
MFSKPEAGVMYFDYVPAEKRQARIESAQKVLKGESLSYETSYTHKNGSITWYQVRMVGVTDSVGKSLGLVMAINDITQRKLAEIEIKSLNESLEKRVAQRTEELEQANKELESYSYTVSHDLRAPVRVINGFSKILLNEYGNKIEPQAREYLDIIAGNTKQMGLLIDDLLNFSKLGKTTISPKPVNMTDVVRAVIAEVRSSNDSCRAEINLKDLDFAKCDNNLIKQVWVNLISNAIKYSGKTEKPAIEIGIAGTNGSAAYYIKDNGAGFDMQQYSKLFTVFHRLHKPSEFEGTGVGLAFVQRIISKHGGKIWAEAKLNEGATFYFTLPK